jgi:large subunit ribosomal protein L22
MLAKAEGKHIRISWRKTKLVLDLIKSKTVEEARSILDTVNKGAAAPIAKVLDSAFANLNHGRQEKFLAKDVVVSRAWANNGPMFKRFRAATMGRATAIRHRTAHILVELDKIVKKEPKKKKSESK